jgi:hypothetical protein
MKIKLIVLIYFLINIFSAKAQSLEPQALETFFQKLDGSWSLISGKSMNMNADGSMGDVWSAVDHKIKVAKTPRAWQLNEGFCQNDSTQRQICADAHAQYIVRNSQLFFVDLAGREVSVTLIKVTSDILTFRQEMGQFTQEITWDLSDSDVWIRATSNRLKGKFVSVSLNSLRKEKR